MENYDNEIVEKKTLVLNKHKVHVLCKNIIYTESYGFEKSKHKGRP